MSSSKEEEEEVGNDDVTIKTTSSPKQVDFHGDDMLLSDDSRYREASYIFDREIAI